MCIPGIILSQRRPERGLGEWPVCKYHVLLWITALSPPSDHARTSLSWSNWSLSLLSPWQHPRAVTTGLQSHPVWLPLFMRILMLLIVFLLQWWGGERGSSSEGWEKKKGNIFFFFFKEWFHGLHGWTARKGSDTQRTSISLVHILTRCQNQSWLESRGKQTKVRDGGGAAKTELGSQLLTNGAYFIPLGFLFQMWIGSLAGWKFLAYYDFYFL